MFNTITIITILAATLSLQGLKPAHLQEYDLVGEMPEILITAPKYENSTEISGLGMMPVVEITAIKKQKETIIWDVPEVVITAPRYGWNQDVKFYYGMMPEVVITAGRYRKLNGLSMLSQMPQTNQSFNRTGANGLTKLNIY